MFNINMVNQVLAVAATGEDDILTDGEDKAPDFTSIVLVRG